MNAPYNGKFRVSQEYKGSAHDGLDLVGVDSKEIHSTVNGTVEKAGWENILNHKQGFGLYVRIRKDGTTDKYYFGHLSSVNVKVGQVVKIGDIIGIEGSTGKSTGSHCHYCVRGNGSKSQIKNVCSISGIPNAKGTYDDGYAARIKAQTAPKPEPVQVATPQPQAPQPIINSSSLKHKVGEVVRYRSFYKSSTDPVSKAIIKPNWRTGTITKVLTNGCHNPYLIGNGTCWINDGDIH